MIKKLIIIKRNNLVELMFLIKIALLRLIWKAFYNFKNKFIISISQNGKLFKRWDIISI